MTMSIRDLFDSGKIHSAFCYVAPDEVPANWTEYDGSVHGAFAITPTGVLWSRESGVWTDRGLA